MFRISKVKLWIAKWHSKDNNFLLHFLGPKIRFVKTFTKFFLNFLRLHSSSNYAFWRSLYLLNLLNEEIQTSYWKTTHEVNSKYRQAIEVSNDHYSRSDIETYMNVRRELIAPKHSFNTSVERVPSNSYFLGNEFTSQFGHVTQITDFFRGKKMGIFEISPIIIASNFSNPWLYSEYISTLMPLIPVSETTNELLQLQFLNRYLQPPLMPSGHDWDHFFEVHNRIESAWSAANLGPVFELSQDDLDFGFEVMMRTYGFRSDSRLVTLHTRHDPRYHSARNVNLASYELAINWLLDNDYWVLRLGDNNGPSLPKKHPHYIEYHNSKIRSDRLDLFLLGINEFMIGCSSGPSELPNLFGKFLIWTNITQLGRHDFKSNALMLPKLFASNHSNTFKNYFELGVFNTECQTAVRGSWRDNDDTEILTAVKEVCAHLELGSTKFTHGSLSSRFENLTRQKFTVIPEFFLDKHEKYFFSQS